MWVDESPFDQKNYSKITQKDYENAVSTGKETCVRLKLTDGKFY